MTHISRVLVTVFSILAITAIGLAQSNGLQHIKKTGVMRVGVSGEQPPYSLMSNSDNLIGFEVDLADLIAQEMHVKLELVQMPFGELLDGLESGKVDVVMSGMTINAQRNMRVLFTSAYNVSGKTILTKSATLASLDTEVEAGNATHKIAVLKGSTSEEFAKSYFPKAVLVATGNYDEAVKALLNDEVEALVADVEICQISMLKYPNEDLEMLNQPLTIEPIGMAVPANDPQLLNLVSNYLDKLEMLTGLEQLRKKWFEDGTWLLQAK